MELNKKEVYDQQLNHIPVPNFGGDFKEVDERFFTAVTEYFATLNLQNIQLNKTTVNIGGGFFGSNNVPAIVIYYKDGKLKNLAAFFFTTHTGNVFNYSLYKQASLGFLDMLTDVTPSEKIATIHSKLKTIAEVEEFSVFNNIANFMYERAIKSATIK